MFRETSDIRSPIALNAMNPSDKLLQWIERLPSKLLALVP